MVQLGGQPRLGFHPIRQAVESGGARHTDEHRTAALLLGVDGDAASLGGARQGDAAPGVRTRGRRRDGGGGRRGGGGGGGRGVAFELQLLSRETQVEVVNDLLVQPSLGRRRSPCVHLQPQRSDVLAEDGVRASQVSKLRFEGRDCCGRVCPQLEQVRAALTGRGREGFLHCEHKARGQSAGYVVC